VVYRFRHFWQPPIAPVSTIAMPVDPPVVCSWSKTSPCHAPPVVATMTMPAAGCHLPPASNRAPYYQ